MTSTGVASGSALQRLATTESTPSSSANISPIDSPRSSPSSTSLSSLASEDASTKKITTQTKLIDANGNPFEIPDYTIGDIHKAIPKHCFERSAATGLYYVAARPSLPRRYLLPHESIPHTRKCPVDDCKSWPLGTIHIRARSLRHRSVGFGS